MNLQKWQSSPVFLTVRDILKSDSSPYKFKLSATLHTKTLNYNVFKILSLDVVRNYNEKMMDDVILDVKIPLGDYVYLVYPNKENLELTISYTPLSSLPSSNNGTDRIYQVRYKAIFDPANMTTLGGDITDHSQNNLNLLGFQDVRFHLVDRNVEPLRVMSVQGTYRGVTVEQLISSLMLGISQQVSIEGTPAISGLDMVKPDNDSLINQITIPSGTFISSLPTYLQEQVCGVYKYGIGTYYQRFGDNVPTWFVYPLYDNARFLGSKENKVAIFYGAPPKYTKGVERTYRVKGGVLEAVITAPRYQKDPTDVDQLNQGVGFRLMDHEAFMKKPVIVGDDGTTLGARGNLNRELNFIDRGDGLNFSPVVRNYSTNPYHETSKVSMRQNVPMILVWENSNPDILFPGMSVKFCFMQNDDVVELNGTLHGAHHRYTRQGNLNEVDRYVASSILTLSTEPTSQLPEYDEEQGLDLPVR